MSSIAKDYRTQLGVSRRSSGESTLSKYLRAVSTGQAAHSGRDALPIARPRITCTLSVDQYLLLLDVLDELFVLEGAARFVDRKASHIARSRLSKALATELDTESSVVESLFAVVDRSNVALIRRIASLILPSYELDEELKYDNYFNAENSVVKFEP